MRTNHQPQPSAGFFPVVVLVCSSILLTSCIPVPIKSHEADSRHNISAKTQARLQIGVTAKQDVLLLLGEPDGYTDASFFYRWGESEAFGIPLLPYAPGGPTIPIQHQLGISFDASNRVSSIELTPLK